MKLRKVLAMVLTVLMVSNLVACGSSTTESTTSSETESTTSSEVESTEEASEVDETAAFYEQEATISVMAHLSGDTEACGTWAAEKVKEEFPNVTLELETVPQDDGATITTRAATGDLPDIVQVTDAQTELLVESGSIIELDAYIEELGYKDKISESTEENLLYSSDGHIYQFPNGDAAPILWFYNEAVFEENGVKVPENFDELMDAIEAFNELDIIPLALFAQQAWPTAGLFDMFLLKETDNGIGGLVDGEAYVADEDYQYALSKLQQALDAGLLQDGAVTTDASTAAALFVEGEAAMFINGNWAISTNEADLGDDCKIFTNYPTADAGDEDARATAYVNSGGINGLAISTNAENEELTVAVAASFNYWYLVAKYEMMSDLAVPIITDDLADLELTSMNETLLDMMQTGTLESIRQTYIKDTELATVLGEEMQKLLVGGELSAFTEAIDRLLD